MKLFEEKEEKYQNQRVFFTSASLHYFFSIEEQLNGMKESEGNQ